MSDVLTEDTPAGNEEELRQRIEQLTEQVEELKAVLAKERVTVSYIRNQRDHWRTKYEGLRDSLTVEQLRAAGIDVFFNGEDL